MAQVMTETNVTNGSAQGDVPDKEAIRREWYEMRDALHELLDEISAEAWTRKGESTSWTVKALCGHLLHEMGMLPEMVEHVAAEKDFMNMPSFIAPKANYLITRWKSRNETPATVAEKYDVYFEKALAALERVDDDDWDKGAQFFGAGRWTVAFIFRNVPDHFKEHAAQIREALD